MMVDVADDRLNKKHLSARINALVYDRLEAFRKRVGRSRSEVVDRALEGYLNQHEPQPAPLKVQPRR